MTVSYNRRWAPFNIIEMCSTTVLPCPLCCQPNFPSVDSLRISLVNVTNRPLACPICNDVLLGLDKLTIHLFSHTIDCAGATQPISVIPCEQRIEPAEAPRQDDTVMTANHTEPIKSEEEKSASNPLNEYAISSTAMIVVEPHCDLCGFTFRNQELQRMHMQLVHEIDVDDAERVYNNSLNSPVDRTTLRSSTFQCHLCSKFFKTKGSLRVHLRVVHFFGIPPSGIDNETENGSDTMTISVEEHTDTSSAMEAAILGDLESAASSPTTASIGVNAEAKPWECDICAKSFTTKYFLKKHKRLHTGKLVRIVWGDIILLLRGVARVFTLPIFVMLGCVGISKYFRK